MVLTATLRLTRVAFRGWQTRWLNISYESFCAMLASSVFLSFFSESRGCCCSFLWSSFAPADFIGVELRVSCRPLLRFWYGHQVHSSTNARSIVSLIERGFEYEHIC